MIQRFRALQVPAEETLREGLDSGFEELETSLSVLGRKLGAAFVRVWPFAGGRSIAEARRRLSEDGGATSTWRL